MDVVKQVLWGSVGGTSVVGVIVCTVGGEQ